MCHTVANLKKIIKTFLKDWNFSGMVWNLQLLPSKEITNPIAFYLAIVDHTVTSVLL